MIQPPTPRSFSFDLSKESSDTDRMKNQETVAREFKADLNALLKKYRASIEIQDTGRSFYSSPTMMVSIDGVYENGECISDYTYVDLGTNIS